MDEATAFKVTNPYAEVARLRNELEGERESRIRLDTALRQKDEAMGVLFERLNKAGVDYSDLIS